MFSFKRSLIALVGVLVLAGGLAALMPIVSRGQGNSNQPLNVIVSNTPLPVTGTVAIGNIVKIQPAVPPRAFNLFVDGGGKILGPDPAGTSYAITSFTVANPGATTKQVTLYSFYGTTSDCTSFSGSAPLDEIGPSVMVPAGETVHLAFPQPILLSAQPGAFSCLVTDNLSPGTIYVVGYRF